MRKILRTMVLFFMIIILASMIACGGDETPEITESQEISTGTIIIGVTDQPDKDITSIVVTANLIEASVTNTEEGDNWQTLLDTETPISRLRGQFYDYHGTKLMPTYHPAYLLRNPHGKKDVWEDMKKIAKELGVKIPRKK